MKLTGQCKKQFNGWVNSNYHTNKIVFPLNECLLECYHSENFGRLPQSMQYGIYLDFFDSVGIVIHSKVPLRSGEWSVYVSSSILLTETRQEAREKSIIKANEIYNENSNNSNTNDSNNLV